jgi:hypothetical protein
VGLGQWRHPLAGEGLGEANAVAAGLADVGVVQQPVDGGGCQGFGHQLVEGIWGWHMFVRGDLPWDQVRCVPVCLSGPQGVETLE